MGAKTIFDELHGGYDQEEAYFHKINQELIERLHQARAEDVCSEAVVTASAVQAPHSLRESWRRLLGKALQPLPTGIGQFPV